MANEYTHLATVVDGNIDLRVEIVHREDGGTGYRLQVFDTDLGEDYVEEVETSCVRPQRPLDKASQLSVR